MGLCLNVPLKKEMTRTVFGYLKGTVESIKSINSIKMGTYFPLQNSLWVRL